MLSIVPYGIETFSSVNSTKVFIRLSIVPYGIETLPLPCNRAWFYASQSYLMELKQYRSLDVRLNRRSLNRTLWN